MQSYRGGAGCYTDALSTFWFGEVLSEVIVATSLQTQPLISASHDSSGYSVKPWNCRYVAERQSCDGHCNDSSVANMPVTWAKWGRKWTRDQGKRSVSVSSHAASLHHTQACTISDANSWFQQASKGRSGWCFKGWKELFGNTDDCFCFSVCHVGVNLPRRCHASHTNARYATWG